MKQYHQFEKLVELGGKWKNFNLRDVFVNDSERSKKMSIEKVGLWMDYSKSLVDEEVMRLLMEMAREAQVEDWREMMFGGEKINLTENRAVLHTALRYRGSENLVVDGVNINDGVEAELAKMAKFCNAVRDGGWRGYSGREITDVVNIGIGGSDLGPKMVVEALKPYHHARMKFHFVSNVDGSDLENVVANLNPETTVFIVASKTFTTQETMMNAESAKKWFIDKTGNRGVVSAHFVAVSTNLEAVGEFGIGSENVFGFWDWVGGRYSVWGAVGLVVMMAIGEENFYDFLSGGYEMDEHFRTSPLEENLPMILGMIGIWYRNFMNFGSYAILPYEQNLNQFPAHLQQLDMESNGKSVDRNGEQVDYQTGAVVWGEPGTNGQHAFYQLLHQGTEVVPADFLVGANGADSLDDHHRILLANCLAQGDALAFGKTTQEVMMELEEQGLEEERAKSLASHKTFAGNRPSILLVYPKLTPRVLGSLLALYEHKVFVQGIIWEINSFDQMGVELGKVLAKKYDKLLASDSDETEALVKIKQLKDQV